MLRDQSPTLDYMILSPACYHSVWKAMASPYPFETWIIDRRALSDFSLAIVRDYRRVTSLFSFHPLERFLLLYLNYNLKQSQCLTT